MKIENLKDYIKKFIGKYTSRKMQPMNMDETILFLKKYGATDIETTDLYIYFKYFNRDYTIQYHHTYKTLVIGDIRKHHDLPIYSFVFMAYDFCYPMPFNGNDNITFSYEQKFNSISMKYEPKSAGAFRLRIEKERIEK